MNIITQSIKDDLEIQLNKHISEVLSDELKEIKKITVNRLGFGEEILQVDFEELKYFESLEELTLFNCMIDKQLMNIIMDLKMLRGLKIYNCDFVDYPNNMFENLKLKELTLSNCLGVENVEFKNYLYLELKNTDIKSNIENIGILNISNINEKIDFYKIKNIKKIIISETDYNKNKRIIDGKFNGVIMDNKMNVIGEMKNDNI